jgi:hypothetical protein
MTATIHPTPVALEPYMTYTVSTSPSSRLDSVLNERIHAIHNSQSRSRPAAS